MINKITVSENRGLYPTKSNLGTIGERNATELVFQLPASLQGYAMSLVIVTAQGSFVYDLTDNTFTLPSEVLTDNTLDLQLILKDAETVIWKSIPTTFYLNPTLDSTGENIVDKAKSEQREADRAELGGALKDLTGEDVGAEEWDGLIDKTKTLPIKAEQDILDLTDYSALTYAFSRSKATPSLITSGYNLEKDDDGFDIYIKLPYIDTQNATWRTTTRIAEGIVECGLSVKSSGETACVNERSFVNALGGTIPSTLEKITIADFEVLKTPECFFSGCSNLTEITLIERNSPRDDYGAYWKELFRNCKNLQAILGTPLDMSRGTAYLRTFQYCYALRYVRFKTGTICHGLDLSDCSQLMNRYRAQGIVDPGTLLSIVNGVREYRSGMEQITITFHPFVKDYLTSWRCQKDPETGLYVEAEQGYTLATILTNHKGVIIA